MTRIIGHRGARGHAPENTLASIERAIELGCDMVEFDVQLREDSLLLLHDPSVDRTTNGSGLFDTLSVATLRGLDAGDGQRIPTLDEVLTCVDRRVALNVEIKSAGGTAAQVAAVLNAALQQGWPAELLLVSSFDHHQLAAFRSAAPSIPVAPLLCGVPLDLAACATALGARALHISADFADRALIDDAHARGCAVHAYTVNDVALAWRLVAAGVDGLFSDYPERIRSGLGL